MRQPKQSHYQLAVVEAVRHLCHPKTKTPLANLPVEDCLRIIFKHPRIDDNRIDGGRLTKIGLDLVSRVYQSWDVKIDKILTGKQVLRFSRACRLPFFISETRIVSFESDVGAFLALISENMDLMDNVLPLRR